MKRLLLIGGGGHCASCIEVIESTGEWEIAGIIDSPETVGKTLFEYSIIGNDSDLPNLVAKIPAALVTVGQLKSAGTRLKLFELAARSGFKLPVIHGSTACISRRSHLGAGTIVMHFALVNADTKVGKNCIINSGAIVEHDVRIGDHCHVSTNATVNGGCMIGDRCFIGSGAVIKNGIRIGSDCVIGAGAVVVEDVVEPGIYTGCPARKMA